MSHERPPNDASSSPSAAELPPRFARVLRQARALHRSRIEGADVRLLEARIQQALAATGRPADVYPADVRPAGRQRGWRRTAVAALLFVAVGATALFGLPTGGDEDVAYAVPLAALDAADIARNVPYGLDLERVRSCTGSAGRPIYAFPPVRDNVFVVERCAVDSQGPTAKATGERVRGRLVRPEDLPVVGLVAVPDDDTRRGADIGKTDLGDIVVYDVSYGRTRYYLGVSKREVVEKGDCRVCHHADRVQGSNPHRIVLRQQ